MTTEEKVYRVVLLLALIAVALDILIWRPLDGNAYRFTKAMGS